MASKTKLPSTQTANLKTKPGFLKLRLSLLAVWAFACFGLTWWARDLDFNFFGWPFGFWWAAQGAVLCFIAIAVVNAWYINRHCHEAEHVQSCDPDDNTTKARLM